MSNNVDLIKKRTISLLPLDIGFDLRVHDIDMTVDFETLKEHRHIKYLDKDNKEKTISIDDPSLISILLSAGYRIGFQQRRKQNEDFN